MTKRDFGGHVMLLEPGSKDPVRCEECNHDVFIEGRTISTGGIRYKCSRCAAVYMVEEPTVKN